MGSFKKHFKKFTFERFALFLNAFLVAGILWSVNSIIIFSKHTGFEFQITDLLFTLFGYFFSSLMYTLGHFVISKSKHKFTKDLYKGQTWEDKLQYLGHNLGESLHQLVNFSFMCYCFYNTKYCPRTLHGSMNLQEVSLEDHEIDITKQVQFVYMVGLGYSFNKLFTHFGDQTPSSHKTYYTFLFHHLLTSALIFVSYILGLTRWGFAIWFLHEPNESLMKMNRVIRQMNGFTAVSKIIFLFFGIFWIYLRVYGYFVDILMPLYELSFFRQYEHQYSLYLSRGFLFGLSTLFILNVQWGIDIIIAVYRKLKYNKNDRVVEDQKKYKQIKTD